MQAWVSYPSKVLVEIFYPMFGQLLILKPSFEDEKGVIKYVEDFSVICTFTQQKSILAIPQLIHWVSIYQVSSIPQSV